MNDTKPEEYAIPITCQTS